MDTGIAKSMLLGPGPSSHQAGNISHRISCPIIFYPKCPQSWRGRGWEERKTERKPQKVLASSHSAPNLNWWQWQHCAPVRHHPQPSPSPYFCFPTHTEAYCQRYPPCNASGPSFRAFFPLITMFITEAVVLALTPEWPSLLPRPRARELQLRNFHRSN